MPRLVLTENFFFKEEKISISKIKKGDRVRVDSKENILTKEEFTAKKIVISG